MIRLSAGQGAFAAALWLAVPAGLPAARAAAAETTTRRAFETAADFDACRRDAAIDAASREGAVCLLKEDYLVDTAGDRLFKPDPAAIYGRKRTFGKEWMGKKTFALESKEAEGAEIYAFGRGGMGTFNGHAVVFRDFPHHGGWSRADVQADWLRAGVNELVIEQGLGVPQDRDAVPADHSFVSRDQGQTWQPAREGEFLIQLRLLRHPGRGSLTSPVIDLAEPNDEPAVRPLLRVATVRISHESRTPPGTAVLLEARSGPTPLPGPEWTDWNSAAELAPARYVQWRATLRTAHPLRTPTGSL